MEKSNGTEVRTCSLDELCTLTGVSKRTVRYYIQNGLVDRPDGANKGARYGQRHIEQLLSIRRWQAAGLSLERIRALTGDAPLSMSEPPRKPGSILVCSHVLIAPGIELVVDPQRCGLDHEGVRSFVEAVMRVAETIVKDPGQGGDS